MNAAFLSKLGVSKQVLNWDLVRNQQRNQKVKTFVSTIQNSEPPTHAL
jgi:hypothetical protein